MTDKPNTLSDPYTAYRAARASTPKNGPSLELMQTLRSLEARIIATPPRSPGDAAILIEILKRHLTTDNRAAALQATASLEVGFKAWPVNTLNLERKRAQAELPALSLQDAHGTVWPVAWAAAERGNSNRHITRSAIHRQAESDPDFSLALTVWAGNVLAKRAGTALHNFRRSVNRHTEDAPEGDPVLSLYAEYQASTDIDAQAEIAGRLCRAVPTTLDGAAVLCRFSDPYFERGPFNAPEPKTDDRAAGLGVLKFLEEWSDMAALNRDRRKRSDGLFHNWLQAWEGVNGNVPANHPASIRYDAAFKALSSTSDASAYGLATKVFVFFTLEHFAPEDVLARTLWQDAFEIVTKATPLPKDQYRI